MPRPSERLPFFDDYLSAIGRRPLLSAAQERELGRAVRAGSTAARDALVEANLRLVVHVASRFAGRGLDLPDLVCEGNVGLLRAAAKFDPDAGCRFSTYAVWWINQAIRRALEQAQLVRVPAHARTRASAWKRAEARLAARLGRPPAEHEVDRRLGLRSGRPATLRAALAVAATVRVPFDARRPDDGQELRDALVADDGPSAADELDRRAGLERLARLLSRLDARSRSILELRFGFGGREPLTLVEVGAGLGLTRERVRQLEKRALMRLAIAYRHGDGALAPRKQRTPSGVAPA